MNREDTERLRLLIEAKEKDLASDNDTYKLLLQQREQITTDINKLLTSMDSKRSLYYTLLNILVVG